MAANAKQHASDFEKIINAGRDRKKNETLAAKIFNRDRRSSTPQRGPAPGGSLASRAGVTKQRAVSSAAPRQNTIGDINGEWTHDLHGSQSARRGSPAAGARPGSLAARISNPSGGGGGARGGSSSASFNNGNPRQQRRAAQVAQALTRTELQPAASTARVSPVSQGGSGGSFNKGLTIRGLAGPFAVMAQNFAPGTTAADIESAMTPIGGIITSCYVVKQHPIVIAEIVFESREGAESVISTFNNQTADGRVLSVYPKVGSSTVAPPTAPRAQTEAAAAVQPPTGPRALREEVVIDGSMGFNDLMETDDVVYPNGNGRQPPRGPAAGVGRGSGLYSDEMVRGNRRGGRGYGRGGRGGGR
ncbi:hypothetical protein B0T17DRAFT_106016 [Bombardia bombarda]|uniref:RRM domain-containing protein n=1 Tax=Bombardia bombarda TaxID=252184 RepID=A0AA40CH41_9PEZI|nr:hypothetical protein B0T17DRAFT_106016 [Bombardia bombarda]